MPRTQANRFIAIDTPLGKDILLLRGFHGHEGISQLFMFELDLLSEDPAVKFEDIIGKRVTIRVALRNGKERYFNGFISRFRQVGSDSGLTNYRATMVPWLWFLTQTMDCRIFQNKSIPDIIEQIFKELGFTDFKTLKGYEPREYCVQYRETDFNFVSRLMEQYGISYFFAHEKNKHTLVLADASSAYQTCPEQSKVKWEPTSAGRAEDTIMSLEIEQEFRPGKYALTDYNFKTPSTTLAAEVQSTIKVADNSKYEVYDYPGAYEKKKDGDKRVRLRMEEEEAQHLKITGTSMCRAFTSGYRFDLVEYIRPDMNKAYLLTEIRHTGSVGNTYTTGEVAGNEEYSNSFTTIPHGVLFRPLRMTPKPIIQGSQTAVVVGKPGEAIWCDNFGRVKVQFFWDREGKKDDQSSCWMRVSQGWGGKNWGGMFIPHVGQEVIVSFMEGDPDQPIITGRVYNAEMMPPLELPANATKSMIRDHGGNHIRMEGKAGSEQIHLYSPYGKSKISIGAPNQCPGLEFKTENKCKIEIGEDEEKLIKGMCSETIEKSKTIKILEDEIKEIKGEMHHTVHGPEFEVFKAYFVKVVIGALNETAGSISELCLGNKTDITIGTNITYEKAWELDLSQVGKKRKCSKLQELMHEHKEFTEKMETRAEQRKDKYEKLMQKIEDVELASKKWKGKIGEEFKLEAKKLTHKSDKIFLKAADASMDYDKAKMICNTLKLC